MIRKDVPISLFYRNSWKSHEHSAMFRHARAMKESGVNSDEIVEFLFNQDSKLQTELDQITLAWNEIQIFVNNNDENGYIEFYKKSANRNVGEYELEDAKQRFRGWVIDSK